MIKVRFYVTGQEHPVQDHEMPAAPRAFDRVELTMADGTAMVFIADRVTWTPHDVIPADVVITLNAIGDALP